MKDSEFLHILAKYKFVLAIENAVCPDYITEKLWKVLQVGAVPVYFGAPNVQVCMIIIYFTGHQARLNFEKSNALDYMIKKQSKSCEILIKILLKNSTYIYSFNS